MSARRVAVLTHRRTEETREALRRLIEMACVADTTLCFDAEETAKHGLQAGPGVEVDARIGTEEELCVVLGGDGTILRALRLYAGTQVPVFAINFGEIGFLATVEPQEIEEGIARALEGRFELLRLPGIALETPHGREIAINDIAIHRRVGERVAELAYGLDGEEVGSVRCDGLVLATPAGSTGYNLANGGPVMAWGVEGFVVSFIAPHSITARALVAAPGDPITIHNRSREALDVSVDGRPVCDLPADERIRARFVHDVGTIAQLPGSSFYRRLREKFGRLAR
ncbi:MAG TPA: NAD(+)/NADH kinase [Solirubrobacteraceae bacterium]|jgi:NAD+ kinase|nr:NAD(+)/NADH kinase [Solirubrobacteraceae bacterium]